jgi:hypothetical protein
MRTSKLRRRAFLGGLGLGALAPFVPLLDVEAADPVKRLLLFYSPFGTSFEKWRPTGSASDFSFTGTVTAPLEPHKQDLVVLDGMRISWDESTGDPHQKGMGMLWSGSALVPEGPFEPGGMPDAVPVGFGGGITIDQHIANELDVQTAWRSLELAVDTQDVDVRCRMSYAGKNQPLTPYVDPRTAFDALFSSIVAEPEELKRLRAERKSVLDLAGKHLGRLQTKVSAHDRYKIDAHLTAVGAIEKKLDALAGACAPGEPPPEIDPFDSNQFMQLASAQIDVMVLAMACDLTRIGGIQLKDENGGYVEWLGTSEHFHNLSHDTAALPTMEAAYHDFAVVFAELLEKLKATPAATGGNLLDSTLVAWGCANATGHHDDSPMPFMLAGSAGGAFETGRWLQYDSMEHWRLLVSICNAMGVQAMAGDKFGDIDSGSGPLPGLV